MEFIEYPKALYRDGAIRFVDDADQEAAARAERFDNWADDQARIAAPADDGHVDMIKAPIETTINAPGRDALKARATELGIEYPPNIKTDKLAALVATAQG